MKKAREAEPVLRESAISSSFVASKSISFTPLASTPSVASIPQTGRIPAASFMLDMPSLLRGTGDGIYAISNPEAMEKQKQKEEAEKDPEKKEAGSGAEAKKSSEVKVKIEKGEANAKVEGERADGLNDRNRDGHSLPVEKQIKTESAVSSSMAPSLKSEAPPNPSAFSASSAPSISASVAASAAASASASAASSLPGTAKVALPNLTQIQTNGNQTNEVQTNQTQSTQTQTTQTNQTQNSRQTVESESTRLKRPSPLESLAKEEASPNHSAAEPAAALAEVKKQEKPAEGRSLDSLLLRSCAAGSSQSR